VTLELQPFGDGAWRVRLPVGSNRPSILAALRELPWVLDAVVSEHHALVTFDTGTRPTGVTEIAGAIDRAAAAPSSSSQAREHLVRVRYGAADSADVARAAGIGQDDLASLHAAPLYEVAAIGFLPGFAYLRGLDARLVVARRASPRPRVPALSVAVAGPYTGIYPFAAPGGWNLIGVAVDFTPFDAGRGAAFALGDRVRFAQEAP
jgi:UPF0271 protein